MAIPFPYEGTAGAVTDQAEGETVNLYRQFVWVARLVDEMNAATDLDLKKTMQLVFHSRKFREVYEALQARITAGTHTQAQIADIIEGVFGAKKCKWATRAAMLSELAGLYTAAGNAADFIEANAGAYKTGYSINKITDSGGMTDEPIKIAKHAGVATRLTDFRALFGANASALKG